MASISKDKTNGTKRIFYYDADGNQKSMRLGKIPMKAAETIKVHVENLLTAQAMGVSVGSETARWLTEIPDQLHKKFSDKKLVLPRRVVGTLGEVIPKIIKERSVDVAPATVEIWGQSRESLYRYFGNDRRIDKITEAEAKEFCLWLAKHGRLKDSGTLKPSTVSKRVEHVVMFFHILLEKGDIPRNPFVGLAKKEGIDDARNKYIDEETILKVMEYAPDAEWRLIIALWRFAGLRAASEVLMLKWEDILWDQKMIMVPSPKTKRYKGKAFRRIPFFPHLEEALTEAFEQAKEGAVYVVEKHAPLYLRGQKERTYISRQGNLGTVFKKIIRRAGIVPWQKLIHNLRASFETDLLNAKYGQFGLHTIAGWLGHSVEIMLKHYGRTQKADFDRIEQACQQVNQKKGQTMGHVEAHLVPFLAQNEGFTVENAETNPSPMVELKAALYTAAGEENGGNGAESSFSTIRRNPLKTRYLTAKNGNGRHTTQTSQITTAEDKGFEPSTGRPATDFESARSPFAYPPVSTTSKRVLNMCKQSLIVSPAAQ